MRVLFLGNHTVGVKALQAISETDTLVGVVAHPPDPEDGTRYESVYEFASKHGWPVLRSTGQDPLLESFIREVRPDLLWITDYRYLLPSSLVSLASYGVVNLHPSLLPKYRGRASINWAILNGETELGLTAHFVDEGMDTGDIIAQIKYDLNENQDIGDALQILYPLYKRLTQQVLSYFHAGQVPRQPQNQAQATAFPRRKPEDGCIPWAQSAERVRNLVRAVATPYPGAFTFFSGQKLWVWRAKISSLPALPDYIPGQVQQVDCEGIHVQCGSGVVILTLTEFLDKNNAAQICAGDVLGQ